MKDCVVRDYIEKKAENNNNSLKENGTIKFEIRIGGLPHERTCNEY